MQIDQSQIALAVTLALVIGFSGGYKVRSAISVQRRRRFQRLRRADALGAFEADRALTSKTENDEPSTTTTLAPSEAT